MLPDINAICDALAIRVEPDPSLREDSRARPVAGYEIDRLYVWPGVEVVTTIDTGETGQDDLTLRLAWAEDRIGEVDDLDRGVSDGIVARAERLKAVIAADQSLGDVVTAITRVAIDYEGLRGEGARGFLATVTGYRIREE